MSICAHLMKMCVCFFSLYTIVSRVYNFPSLFGYRGPEDTTTIHPATGNASESPASSATTTTAPAADSSSDAEKSGGKKSGAHHGGGEARGESVREKERERKSE